MAVKMTALKFHFENIQILWKPDTANPSKGMTHGKIEDIKERILGKLPDDFQYYKQIDATLDNDYDMLQHPNNCVYDLHKNKNAFIKTIQYGIRENLESYDDFYSEPAQTEVSNDEDLDEDFGHEDDFKSEKNNDEEFDEL